jgi:hypothetical protein
MPKNVLQAVKHEGQVRGLKILDMGYIACIYFVVGIVLAKVFDKLFGPYDEKEEAKKSFFQKTLELIGMMWAFGIVTYIVRNLIEFIPSPFNGYYGFNHLLVKELKSATVFTFVFLYFQAHFKAKLQSYYNSLA